MLGFWSMPWLYSAVDSFAWSPYRIFIWGVRVSGCIGRFPYWVFPPFFCILGFPMVVFPTNHQPTNSPNAQRSKVGWPYYGGTVDCRLYLVGLWYVVCGPHHQSLRFGAELQLGIDLLKPVLKGFKNWVLTSFRTELWGAIFRFRVFPGPNERAGICSCSRNEAI